MPEGGEITSKKKAEKLKGEGKKWAALREQTLILEPEQEEALKRMHNGCVLCGGVGSGKSIVGIAYYISSGCRGRWGAFPMMKSPRNLYIITTAMKRDKNEWNDDLTKFGLNEDPEANLYSVDVVVDSWNNIKKYTGVRDAFFIFDEQRVVGSGAWAKAFQQIVRKNQWILLSATPGDTWADYVQIFIANGFYRNKTEFENRHVIWARFSKFPKVDRYLEQEYLMSLRERVLVDMNFERHTERHVYNEIVPYDWKLYKTVMKSRKNPWTGEPIVNISELCSVLRKISNTHPERIREVADVIRRRGRCIVFYNFNYELDLLKEMCRKNGMIFAEWNGHAHEPIPESCDWVYLVQYTAGAEGWNCTSCNTMIFFSPSYSWRSMEQAAGRIDRRNTPFKDLYYYHFRSTSQIDLAINRALKRKEKFNETRYFSKIGVKFAP